MILFYLFFSFACAAPLNPTFIEKDLKRPQVQVTLVALPGRFESPTTIRPWPKSTDILAVSEQAGFLKTVDQKTGVVRTLLKLKNIPSHSELGFLGFAFHPRFPEQPKVFTHYTIKKNKKYFSRISEWTVKKNQFQNERVLLEILQPYSNHNGGHLEFGPDGFLYIGLGDGGSANDPHGNAQNKGTLLGSMLRIDVNTTSGSLPYGIPSDNPFVGHKNSRPEIWAIGLRNPWRYSFTPNGELVVGDVGQNKWEEITLVTKGSNQGWNRLEGSHCFGGSFFSSPPKCDQTKVTLPIYEYSHAEGASVTGGMVYQGRSLPKLHGKYVFGDFESGRFWALDLKKKGKIWSLGKFSVSPSCFGLLPSGELLVADHKEGRIYQFQKR